MPFSEEARQAVVQEEALRELATAKLAAVREVHTRLAQLYPEYAIAHMPSSAIQQARGDGFSQRPGVDAGDRNSEAAGSAAQDGVARHHGPSDDEAFSPEGAHASSRQDLDDATAADCDQFVGNAAVYGDCFRWHIDADPAGALFCSACTPDSATLFMHCHAVTSLLPEVMSPAHARPYLAINMTDDEVRSCLRLRATPSNVRLGCCCC